MGRLLPCCARANSRHNERGCYTTASSVTKPLRGLRSNTGPRPSTPGTPAQVCGIRHAGTLHTRPRLAHTCHSARRSEHRLTQQAVHPQHRTRRHATPHTHTHVPLGIPVRPACRQIHSSCRGTTHHRGTPRRTYGRVSTKKTTRIRCIDRTCGYRRKGERRQRLPGWRHATPTGGMPTHARSGYRPYSTSSH